MITIAAAGPEQSAHIAELAREVWTEHYSGILALEQIDYMLRTFQSAEKISEDLGHGYRYDVARDDGGALVGYCASRLDETALYLSKLYVLKDYRGQKLSRRFLSRLLQTAREQNKPVIRLSVNKENPTLAIYHHLGFTIADATLTPFGPGYFFDDYQMELPV
jgi:ribosomal protein S18 acetylase RimI-like enzyme